MATRITFNGTEYNRPEDMPPAVRDAYEKALALVKSGGTSGSVFPKLNIKVSTKVRFVHDGKVYENVNDMPADVRDKYEKAMGEVDKDRNGVPDFLESGTSVAQTPSDDPFRATDTASAPLVSQPPVIAPEAGSSRLLLIALGIILLLLVVIGGLALYILAH